MMMTCTMAGAVPGLERRRGVVGFRRL